MSLTALIQKNGLRQLATLTVATSATPFESIPETVASVAIVAVANPGDEKTPVIDNAFFDDDRRHCSECRQLSGGRCLAAWRGEIAAANHYRPVDDLPRRCAGFAPKANDPDPLGLAALDGISATSSQCKKRIKI